MVAVELLTILMWRTASIHFKHFFVIRRLWSKKNAWTVYRYYNIVYFYFIGWVVEIPSDFVLSKPALYLCAF